MKETQSNLIQDDGVQVLERAAMHIVDAAQFEPFTAEDGANVEDALNILDGALRELTGYNERREAIAASGLAQAMQAEMDAQKAEMKIWIVSGEGEIGSAELYTGKLTLRALRMRLTRERCHGDRWAYIKVGGQRVNELASVLYMASVDRASRGQSV